MGLGAVGALKSVGLALVALGAMAQVAPVDPLLKARQLYNEHRYDEAIEAATEARKLPTLANAAAVVFARASLERFRLTRVSDDLTAARDALKEVEHAKLSPRDRVELLVGLGESLYLDGCLDGCYSAAAQTFELALDRALDADLTARALIFEWWAGSLDRQAQMGPPADRQPLYQRILRRSEEELAKNELSATATYWLAAASRGLEDYERAWGAAIAGWVRARYMGPEGAELRADLERLVSKVLLPERARQLAPDGDARPALATLQAQWEELKKKYE